MFLSRAAPFVVLCTLSYHVQAYALSSRHSESAKRSLPGGWYHRDESHPALSLFRRDASSDGINYPEVGSSTWSAAYPSSTPDSSQYPQQWIDALNAAVSAGKIPDIPVASESNGQTPTYPSGTDPSSAEVCSGSLKCRNMDTDIWDAPDGHIGIGFDDGPLPPSKTLYNFLQQNNQRATHFMIGVNILNNPDEFQMAFDTLDDDIAVHTWTHPYMTTLTNEEILGQFGWTMEIIHNSTGGRLPKYWRPPYGDADNRVRAIAKEVFGLTTIFWNQDTEDWSIGESGGTTLSKVNASMQQWLTGPKSPGLIILEHELSNDTVQAFMDAYPVMKANGWETTSVAEFNGTSAYSNADSENPNGAVTPVGNILPGFTVSSSATNASSSTVQGSSSLVASSTATSSSAASRGSTSITSTSASPTSSTSSAARTNGQLSSHLFAILLSTCSASLLSFIFLA